MNWRVQILTIAGALTLAATFSLAAVDATVTLQCATVPTAPQCPTGGSSGVLLISETGTKSGATTKGTLTFGSIDDSFTQAMTFRKDRAPAYKQVTWATAETLAFTGGHAELPLRIWAVCTDKLGTCPALTAVRRNKLNDMVLKANNLLSRERTGIKLVPPADGTLISDESGTPALTALKVPESCAAFKVEAMRLNKFAKNALNIYIVHKVEGEGTAQTNFGEECGNGVAVVGATGNWALILHEIGHMLALDHVRDSRSAWGSNPEANFMRHDSGSRKFFTEGQIFRMHLERNSAINVLLKRHPGDMRWCDSDPVLPCPKLNARVWDEP